jgi:hypothetical protein
MNHLLTVDRFLSAASFLLAAGLVLASCPTALAAIVHQAYLNASNAESPDGFGCSVTVSEDTVLAGAWLEDGRAGYLSRNQRDNGANGAGAAYVFTGVGLPMNNA